MSLPEFSAEASLYKSEYVYRLLRNDIQYSFIVSAQKGCEDCRFDCDQCWADCWSTGCHPMMRRLCANICRRCSLIC